MCLSLVFSAFATRLAAAIGHAAPTALHGSVPVWAVFSFAVSAFRDPLR